MSWRLKMCDWFGHAWRFTAINNRPLVRGSVSDPITDQYVAWAHHRCERCGARHAVGIRNEIMRGDDNRVIKAAVK